jgi:hypothetical protein
MFFQDIVQDNYLGDDGKDRDDASSTFSPSKERPEEGSRVFFFFEMADLVRDAGVVHGLGMSTSFLRSRMLSRSSRTMVGESLLNPVVRKTCQYNICLAKNTGYRRRILTRHIEE